MYINNTTEANENRAPTFLVAANARDNITISKILKNIFRRVARTGAELNKMKIIKLNK